MLRPGVSFPDGVELLDGKGGLLGHAGRDLSSGAAVAIWPRGGPRLWVSDLRREALARRVRGSPSTVAVLHVGPGVVLAEPGPVRAPDRLSRDDAATCALAACEVLAGLHAAGFGGCREEVSYRPEHLRVCADGRTIEWRIPSVDPPPDLTREVSDEQIDELFGDELGPIVEDLRRLLARFPELAHDLTTPTRVAAWQQIVRLIGDEPDTSPTAARLAQLLLPLLDHPEAWRARVAALPVVRALPPVAYPWDDIIAESETMLARSHPTFAGWFAVPLSTAYHQRASRSFAGGELAAALRDVDRALELADFFHYHTTRAIVLDALARRDEARAAIDAAISQPRGKYRDGWTNIDSQHERARAHATRGSFALHDGDLAAAEADLRSACESAPEPAYLHLLAAALHARGDLAAAAALSTEAVLLAPEDARLRWGLAVRLHELGRVDEAREHAERALARAPGVYADRFARRFG